MADAPPSLCPTLNPSSEAKPGGLEFMKYYTTESEHAIPNQSNPDALGGYTQVDISSQHSQFYDGMEFDSVLWPTIQTAGKSEIKDGNDFPPYFKILLKQMESPAFREQTKTNSILADNLSMLVDNFARMGERMSSVQKNNADL
jgi:hypothetical protein